MESNQQITKNQKTEHYQILKTSPKKYLEAINVTSASEAIYNDAPSIVLIKKDLGEIKVQALVTYMLVNLIESFNIGKTMNETQVVDCVKDIVQDYYFLKPTELKYCFANARKGRYGKVYDRIDQQIIYEWLEKYLKEREEVSVNQNVNNKKRNEQEFNELILPVLKKVSEDIKQTETKDELSFLFLVT